ncbi:MAG: hypothetical protein KDB07_07110, partial [Planctomycetes bacterium]|nr:hypothetical protein [Planctomycetota bacterium]
QHQGRLEPLLARGIIVPGHRRRHGFRRFGSDVRCCGVGALLSRRTRANLAGVTAEIAKGGPWVYDVREPWLFERRRGSLVGFKSN